jgi:hypothetical protein
MSEWGIRHNTTRMMKKYIFPDSDFNNIPLSLLTDGEKFIHNFDIKKFKNVGGKTYYIDPINGNDGNTGTLEIKPFRSVYKALSVCSNGDTIILLDGVYYRGNWTNDSYIEKSVNIIAKNSGNVIVKNGNNHTFTLHNTYTQTYFAVRDNIAKVVQRLDGFTTELTKVTSINLVNSTEGSYFCDGTNTYVRLFGDDVPNDSNCFLLLSTGRALVHTICSSENVMLYLEGIEFIGGDPATVLFSASSTYIKGLIIVISVLSRKDLGIKVESLPS